MKRLGCLYNVHHGPSLPAGVLRILFPSPSRHFDWSVETVLYTISVSVQGGFLHIKDWSLILRNSSHSIKNISSR